MAGTAAVADPPPRRPPPPPPAYPRGWWGLESREEWVCGCGRGGHRGARGGGGVGSRSKQRRAFACPGFVEGPVGGAGALGERRGRLGQPSSLGVADRSQGRGGRY